MSAEKSKLELKNPVVHQQNENCQVFNGPISGCVFAMPGAIVNQSPVQQVKAQPESDPQRAQDFEYIDFKFFPQDSFDTMEKQNRLRELIQSILPKIDADSGRDWVVVYIACHFFMKRQLRMKRYVDFFSDIEALLPKVLTKVVADKQGDKRYKPYTDSLSYECNSWFIDNDCLPFVQEWKSNRFKYKVEDTRRNRIQELVTSLYQGMKKIE